MAAALANIAKGASSMVGSSGSSKSPAEDKYTLLKSVDKEENIKNIGDGILRTFAKEQMKGIDQINNNSEDLKKQIRKDLIYIYYEHTKDPPDHPVIFAPRNVRKDIKTKILDSWYEALRLRKNDIIKDLTFLLDNRDKIIKTHSKGGAVNFGAALSGLKGKLAAGVQNVTNKVASGKLDAGVQKEILTKMGSDDAGEAGFQNDYKPDKERGNEFYFDQLVKYKTKLFSENVIELKESEYYASGFQAVKLHQKILRKVIGNYSGINRRYLSATLRRMILGDDAIGFISEYKTNKPYKPDPSKAKVMGIFNLFIIQLSNLIYNGNIKDVINYTDMTNSQPQPQSQSYILPESFGGSGEKIPNYMPTSYVWKKIKSHVQQDYKKLIKTNLERQSEHIKTAFKDVFKIVNCDALTFHAYNANESTDEKQDPMNMHLTADFHEMLKLLCEKMPNNYAVSILQNYIKSNFLNFCEFLKGAVFKNAPKTSDTGSFKTYVDAFLYHDKLKLIPPDFYFDEGHKYKGNKDIDEYVEKLEKCCERTLNSKDINPDKEKIPPVIMGIDKAIHLTPIDTLPWIYESLFYPSKDKRYIQLPVFEVFKEQFMQCSDDVEMLAELFNMYSSRSIQFMQKIQGQFFVGNKILDEYIIKFILTKHKYTTKIISECIIHAADKYKTLSDKSHIGDIGEIISKYTAVLISATCEPFDGRAEIENGYYIFLRDHDYKSVVNTIQSNIINGKYEMKDYNADLGKLFALNDTIKPQQVIPDTTAYPVPITNTQQTSLENSPMDPVHGSEVYSQNTNSTQVNSNAQKLNEQLGNVQNNIYKGSQALQGNFILGDQRPPSQRNGLNIGNLGDTFNTSKRFLNLFNQGE